MNSFARMAILLFLISGPAESFAQTDTVTYKITIEETMIKIGEREIKGMTINGNIPGPTLRFKEGDYAVIYVQNNMNVETSIHWHGILLPNFFDGVPYLTTPPVEPGTTFKYEFPIIQSGTYWYHSHTALQEQRGVYGSIVIESEKEKFTYDKDLVVVLGDWTYEKPRNVLRTLKRGLEWYNIKKGTVAPLAEVIARGALGAQLNFWRQRMEGADISDVYYPHFIANGQPVAEYPEFQPGERIRLRIINAAASTQFWLTFGGEPPLLVAADGLVVEPVKREKTFIAVAETYDFILEIPENGKLEVQATAQDGTGKASVLLGNGNTLFAPDDLPLPDLIRMMKEMAAMDMKMGAPAAKFNPKKESPHEMAKKYGMDMEHSDHSQMKEEENVPEDNQEQEHRDHGNQMPKHPEMENIQKEENKHSEHQMKDEDVPADLKEPQMPVNGMDAGQQMQHGDMFAMFNYDFLKAPEKTSFENKNPVREILLNLTGNMNRYIWSMNGIPLSEADDIRIKKGEIVRITLNNLTMMHHPMHLHGHFFRVINRHGAYSPLKHTVNVAPMQKVTLEFDANEYGDWFFHCHILYHMDAGMARVFSYGTPRDERMEDYPAKILTNTSNHFFSWGTADAASHMAELNLVTSNIRNQFMLTAEYGWNTIFEGEFSYGRYLTDFLSLFAGVNIENELVDSYEDTEITAIAGLRYLMPFLFSAGIQMDHRLRPQFEISREILIFKRVAVFGEFEYQADFGIIDEHSADEIQNGIEGYRDDLTWSAGMEYFISKNFSLMAGYDNRFGAGGGLSVRF
jgi:CopA family copper-resistance protein